MRKILFILFLLTLVVGIAGCFGQDTSRIYTNDDIDESADVVPDDANLGESAEPDEAEADDSGAGDVDVGETEESDMPADGEDESELAQSKNIIVEVPLSNSTVVSPFEISGQARVFEGTVLVRVRNQDGRIVIPEQIVNVHGAEQGEFGAFRIKINYQFYATKEGVIEVFSQSAEDGKEINMVEVPVKFE